jgi:hypothetical protein
MEITSFTAIKVYNFSVNDAHAVIQATIDYAQPVKDSLDNLAKASFADMLATNAAMGQRMNQATKSTETGEIDKEDINRDGWWSEIRSDVKTASKSRDSNRQVAGEALKIFFAPYWNLDKKPLNTETDTIKEMLGKLETNTVLTAHAATIGITGKLASLKASNNRVETLYNSRTASNASNSGPSASSLKADAAISYNQFSYLVELANVLTPSDTLKTLFNNMEQVRKKYAPIYNVTINGEGDAATDTATIVNKA